jgi:hypothetical protein
MTDNQRGQNEQSDKEGLEHTTETSNIPLQPGEDVVVTHLDSPPSSSNYAIHPRRPAPIVPDGAPQGTRVDSKNK